MHYMKDIPSDFGPGELRKLHIKNMCTDRKNHQKKIADLLQDTGHSYGDFVKEIGKGGPCQNINAQLISLRHFLNIPMAVLKCKTKTKSGNHITTAALWYPDSKDSALEQDVSRIYLVDNGEHYIGPLVNQAVFETDIDQADVESLLDKAKDILSSMVKRTPVNSKINKTYVLAGKHLTAAREVAGSAAAATAATDEAIVLRELASLPAPPRSIPQGKKRRGSAEKGEEEEGKSGDTETQEGGDTGAPPPKKKKRVTMLPFECCCGTQHSSQGELDTHQHQYHPNRKHWQCQKEGCTSAYTKTTGLWRHVRTIHMGAYLFQCLEPGCSYEGSDSKGALEKHVFSDHPDKNLKPSIYCDKCNKPFSDRSKLEAHIATHPPRGSKILSVK